MENAATYQFCVDIIHAVLYEVNVGLAQSCHLVACAMVLCIHWL